MLETILIKGVDTFLTWNMQKIHKHTYDNVYNSFELKSTQTNEEKEYMSCIPYSSVVESLCMHLYALDQTLSKQSPW